MYAFLVRESASASAERVCVCVKWSAKEVDERARRRWWDAVVPRQVQVVSSFDRGTRSSAVDDLAVELKRRTSGGREQLDTTALAQAEYTQGGDTVIRQVETCTL